MRAVVFAVCVAMVGALACQPKAAAGPIDVGSGTVRDNSGSAQVDLKYRVRAGRELDLIIELNALGLEEMDKLVVDVNVDGLVVIDGETQWSGFVPPRQPQKHEVGLKVPDDATQGVARVNVMRSRDSELLLQRQILVTFEGGTVRAALDE